MKTLTRSDGDAHAAGKERAARDLSPGENAGLCAGCVRCCTYVTVEVDAPRAPWEYDQWIWALHHERISMYVERPEKWFLLIQTRCRKLDEHGRCSIYGRHPVLCRDYDPRTCERRHPLSDVRATFHDAGELEAWLRAHRPRHWERLMVHRRDFTPPAGRDGASPGEAQGALGVLVQIARNGASGPSAPSTRRGG